MFGKLFAIFNNEDELLKLTKKFDSMLEKSSRMFEMATDVLLYNKPTEIIKDELFETDREINQLEVEIRKGIVEHLVFAPADNVPACLYLFSVIKDAERTGDYCKNIFDVRQYYKKNIIDEKYYKYFENAIAKIKIQYKKTRTAFTESDEVKAQEAINIDSEIAHGCENFLKDLFTADIPSDKAICFTLVSRHMKRITCHLGNIASSVVNPVHLMDFFPDLKDEQNH